MRWILISLCLLACCSCKDDKPADYNPEKGSMKRPEPWAGQDKKPQARAAIAAVKPTESTYAPPVPPKDAQFTIYCQDFSGPGHVEVANQSKANLITSSGMKAWYLLHQEDHSSLFYGYYKTANDPAIVRDRGAIQQMRDRAGANVFASAVIVPVDAPDPSAPAEWNLATLRRSPDDSQHAITLQIAVYKDSPERKQAAVEAVKAARSQGIEAYYFHGESMSLVCVGCWPQSSVRVEGEDPEKGVVSPDRNPDQQILVAPGMKLPESGVRQFVKNGDMFAQPGMTILNPTLADAKRRFPDNVVNGMMPTKRDRSGNVVAVPSPSLIVKIPVASVSMGLARSLPGGEVSAPPPDNVRAAMPTNSQPTAGSGRLKSVGK